MKKLTILLILSVSACYQFTVRAVSEDNELRGVEEDQNETPVAEHELGDPVIADGEDDQIVISEMDGQGNEQSSPKAGWGRRRRRWTGGRRRSKRKGCYKYCFKKWMSGRWMKICRQRCPNRG